MNRYDNEVPSKPRGDNLSLTRVEAATAPLVAVSLDEAIIQSFISEGALGAAFKEHQWSPEAEVDMLTSIATNPKLPSKERMAAANILHDRAMERLRYSGHLAVVSARKTSTSSDGSITEELEIVSRIQGRTSDLLRATQGSGKVIDVNEAQTEGKEDLQRKDETNEESSSRPNRAGDEGPVGGPVGGEVGGVNGGRESAPPR
jgi:hypothetical protein